MPESRNLAAVRAVLAKFRAEHGYQPGFIWNPFRDVYVPPGHEYDKPETAAKDTSGQLSDPEVPDA